MKESERIKELQELLITWNEAYRLGDEVVTDEVYDSHRDELYQLDPQNTFFEDIGIDVPDDERKEKLPVELWSMEKIHTLDELQSWVVNKGIDPQSEVLITSKYDGISLCSYEMDRLSWTRGDGIYGQRSHNHFKELNDQPIQISESLITWGEAIMTHQSFEKHQDDFKNPRNLVAGKFNDKTPHPEILQDCFYVRYGMETNDYNYKHEILDFLNQHQLIPVPYEKLTLEKILKFGEDYLKDLFIKWSQDFQLDGLIIEINDLKYQKELGRERNNNPVYARAYKGNFEEVKESVVKSITVQISKRGYLKPVVNIEPIELDGVTVSNPTGYNFRFIKEMGIGVGSKVKVKRSGMVIPKIIDVIETSPFEYPDIGVPIKWNDNKVELITLEATPDQKKKQLESFFKILEVDNVGEGVVNHLFGAGYSSLPQILSITATDISQLDGYQKRKATKIYNSIHQKLKEVTLSKLQHASGCFENLGSKKLLLLEHLDDTATPEDIIKLDGFSEISAQNFIEGYPKYQEFYQSIKDYVTVIKTPKLETITDDLSDMVVVFSGVRRADLKKVIESRGGRVASGVSRNSTHLVMKKIGTGSKKEEKAQELGQEIWTVEQLEDYLSSPLV